MLELRPLIATVGIELPQEWEETEQCAHQQHTAIAVLYVRGMHCGSEQQALSVYQEMPLLAFDLLARIVTMRIDAGPPFSALLTLWLSIIAAVGLASRPANSRHCT